MQDQRIVVSSGKLGGMVLCEIGFGARSVLCFPLNTRSCLHWGLLVMDPVGFIVQLSRDVVNVQNGDVYVRLLGFSGLREAMTTL